jgi:hypothetical protein
MSARVTAFDLVKTDRLEVGCGISNACAASASRHACHPSSAAGERVRLADRDMAPNATIIGMHDDDSSHRDPFVRHEAAELRTDLIYRLAARPRHPLVVGARELIGHPAHAIRAIA